MNKLTANHWLKEYAKGAVASFFNQPATGLVHVNFLFVDHFELAGKEPRLNQWLTKYPQLAGKHVDADGVHPQHTWFYALDLMQEGELEKLRVLVESGYGETELHWHHDHDSPESFQEKLEAGLQTFHRYGFMRSQGDGKPGCFGFIHGNWSLNNARGARYCGVDNEIELLKAAGCYGDFTFPALHCFAQPDMVNSIHYASFERGTAGYFKGRRAEVGRPEGDDEFMIMQGPMTFNWRDWRFKWHPMIENGEIGGSRSHDSPSRIDAWIRQGIHVAGRPDWIFVKVFCHGGQDHQSVLSETTDRMFTYLEQKYNDGVNFKLHYLTSREAYNIVKAAEDGKSGDPNQFRNYAIAHPLQR